MKMTIFLIFTTLISTSAYASNYIDKNITKLDWNGIEVVWLKNETLPLFEMSIYFADGALGDSKSKAGETQLMLNQLSSGTLQYNQKQIADIFEFYGSSIGATVIHEFSSLNFSGMAKDAEPITKMVCHLFSNATFPDKVVSSYKKRMISSLTSIVNDKGSLADRVFREASLKGTQYAVPVDGKISSIKRITPNDLKKRLQSFNENVKKRIYISGPSTIKSLDKVIEKDCKWKGKSDFVRSTQSFSILKNKKSPLIYFLPIDKMNQAQIRIGQTIKPSNKDSERELLGFAANFLGGGFTSKLMQELRVKRGLTYGVSSFAAYQRDYGRAVISTSTKNETIFDAIKVIKDSIEDVANKEFDAAELARKKKFLTGQFLFSFEDSSAILRQLMQLDHIGIAYNTIYDYPEIVNSFTAENVASEVSDIFSWNQQTILVVGSPEIKKDLQKLGRVKVVKLNDYL